MKNVDTKENKDPFCYIFYFLTFPKLSCWISHKFETKSAKTVTLTCWSPGGHFWARCRVAIGWRWQPSPWPWLGIAPISFAKCFGWCTLVWFRSWLCTYLHIYPPVDRLPNNHTWWTLTESIFLLWVHIQKPVVSYDIVHKLLQKSSVSKFVCCIANFFW
jgi:hypothetical protein